MKNFFLALVVIFGGSFAFTSCEAQSTTEMDSLYEVSVDKKKVRTV